MSGVLNKFHSPGLKTVPAPPLVIGYEGTHPILDGSSPLCLLVCIMPADAWDVVCSVSFSLTLVDSKRSAEPHAMPPPPKPPAPLPPPPPPPPPVPAPTLLAALDAALLTHDGPMPEVFRILVSR